MNEKIFGQAQKFSEEKFKSFVKIFKLKKTFGRRFFRSLNIYDCLEKMKTLKTKF